MGSSSYCRFQHPGPALPTRISPLSVSSGLLTTTQTFITMTPEGSPEEPVDKSTRMNSAKRFYALVK